MPPDYFKQADDYYVKILSNPKNFDILQAIQDDNYSDLSISRFEKISSDKYFFLYSVIVFCILAMKSRQIDLFHLTDSLCTASERKFSNNCYERSFILHIHANVRSTIAEMGEYDRNQLEEAVSFSKNSRLCSDFSSETEMYVESLHNEGYIRLIIAEKEKSIDWCYSVMELCQKSRKEGMKKNSSIWALSLLNEAKANSLLAEIQGDKSKQYLDNVIHLCQGVRKDVEKPNTDKYPASYYNESVAYYALAELGIEPIKITL